MTKKLKALIKDGSVMPCPFCAGLNCYSPLDIDEDAGVIRFRTTSCFDWTCGHCDVSFTEQDSPINSECFTHVSE